MWETGNEDEVKRLKVCCYGCVVQCYTKYGLRWKTNSSRFGSACVNVLLNDEPLRVRPYAL